MKNSKSKLLAMFFLVFVFNLLVQGSRAWGWGARGHGLVATTAAYVLADEDLKGENAKRFLKDNSFDLEYYANVPDVVWKKPATFGEEAFNHFMDSEAFSKVLKETPEDLKLSREAFNKKHPDLSNKEGRAFWRIREFNERLEKLAERLRDTKLVGKERQKAQMEWLILAGTMSHYLGDLAQPMHVSENYDGQKTGQKGIHQFYEETLVDELHPELATEVLKVTKARYAAFKKEYGGKSVLDILLNLRQESHGQVDKLMETDKKVGRADLKKAALAHRDMIIDNLARGSLCVAEIWRRSLGWNYDSYKFYDFDPAPKFIPLGLPVVSAKK